MKLQLVILLLSLRVLAQSGLEFTYAAVEITNCIFPVVKSSNLVDWVDCGVIVPIPSQPRDAYCYYLIGADWNTNIQLHLKSTNIVYVYHTNYLAQIPKTTWTTQLVEKYFTSKTSLSSKQGKLSTTLVTTKSLSISPR